MGTLSTATTATDSSSPPSHKGTIIELTPAPSEHQTNNNNTNNDAAPLLPHSTDDIPPDVARDRARIDAIASHAARLAAKRVARQLLVCAVLFVPEAVAIGLVASAMGDWKRVEALPEEARVPV